MNAFDRFKNLGIVISISMVAGGQVFITTEVIQTSSAQEQIIELINARHIDVVDRISKQILETTVAFNEKEKACEVLEATIQSRQYKHTYKCE